MGQHMCREIGCTESNDPFEIEVDPMMTPKMGELDAMERMRAQRDSVLQWYQSKGIDLEDMTEQDMKQMESEMQSVIADAKSRASKPLGISKRRSKQQADWALEGEVFNRDSA